MKTTLSKKKKDSDLATVRISFSITANFDTLILLNERSIKKLKKLIENNKLELSEGNAIHKMLVKQCTSESFDFVSELEDIELNEAERFINYPFDNKSIPL